MLLAQTVLGFYITLAGFLKIFNLEGFVAIVVQYGLVWRKIAKPLAYLQPWIETAGGIMLLSALQPRTEQASLLFYGALVTLAMLLIANFFVFVSLIRKKKMDNCGCYGVAFKVPLDWKKFWVNNLWILLTLFVLL